jgi:hypothetical protein
MFDEEIKTRSNLLVSHPQSTRQPRAPRKILFIRLIIRLFQLVFLAETVFFLSQQINQQYFSASLSAQPNDSDVM